MKKLILTGLIITSTVFTISACSVSKTKADSNQTTYIQSDDNDRPFDRIVIVDKETGCKYLAIVEYSGGRSSITPMYQPDGKPLCK